MIHRSSIYLEVFDNSLPSPNCLFFISVIINEYSQCKRNKSAKRGLQFPPMGIPLTCLKTCPPKETKTSLIMNLIASLNWSLENTLYPAYLFLAKKLLS